MSAATSAMVMLGILDQKKGFVNYFLTLLAVELGFFPRER